MRLTGADIKAMVCGHYGISKDEIEGPSREWRLSQPRIAAYALTRRHCKHLSLHVIGKLYGGRDHTTVREGIMSIDNKPDLKADVDRLSARIEWMIYCEQNTPVADRLRKQIAELQAELARIEAGFEMKEAA